MYSFGEIIPPAVESALEAVNCAAWLQGLILDGIVAGVGAVLGFVPQMLVLFLFLAFLESCGYMTRVAFIMDRIFRKFGLSGKSFIPMLIGSGCGVPGVMASRTIENDRDRKMTIMTTTFVPCGAKLPIIALIAGAFFNNSGWVATSCYFVGIAAIICSGIILKENKNVRWRAGTIRYGASGISLANRWQYSEKHVGERLVFHQESWYHHSSFHNRSLVSHGIRLGRRFLRNGRRTEQQYSCQDWFCYRLDFLLLLDGLKQVKDGRWLWQLLQVLLQKRERCCYIWYALRICRGCRGWS